MVLRPLTASIPAVSPPNVTPDSRTHGDVLTAISDGMVALGMCPSAMSAACYVPRVSLRYMLRMFTARAATTPTVRNDAIAWISIRVLMRTLSGIASVGLKALAFVNAT